METYNSIEVTRQLVKDGKISQEIAETIFPELKESEDERIRKHLIGVVELYYGNTDEQEKKDCLAWLEKQGSQNLANSAKTRKVEQKPSIEICPHSIKSKSYFENGYPVEQNPAWSEKNEAVLDALIRRLEGEDIYVSPHLAVECLKSLKERIQTQPKQEWSEEDEKMVEFWNLYYEHKVGDMPNKDVVEILEKFREWLKSLKERVLPQPKPSWSEDDEDALRVVTNIFEQHGVKLLCYPAFVHWLKTLPNRITFNPYWKPSDEQMEYLSDAIEESNENPVLESLYNDLKKLKG